MLCTSIIGTLLYLKQVTILTKGQRKYSPRLLVEDATLQRAEHIESVREFIYLETRDDSIRRAHRVGRHSGERGRPKTNEIQGRPNWTAAKRQLVKNLSNACPHKNCYYRQVSYESPPPARVGVNEMYLSKIHETWFKLDAVKGIRRGRKENRYSFRSRPHQDKLGRPDQPTWLSAMAIKLGQHICSLGRRSQSSPGVTGKYQSCQSLQSMAVASDGQR